MTESQNEHDYEKDTTMRVSSELLDALDDIESRRETHEACVWRLIEYWEGRRGQEVNNE